jgi:hypothetical protein
MCTQNLVQDSIYKSGQTLPIPKALSYIKSVHMSTMLTFCVPYPLAFLQPMYGLCLSYVNPSSSTTSCNRTTCSAETIRRKIHVNVHVQSCIRGTWEAAPPCNLFVLTKFLCDCTQRVGRICLACTLQQEQPMCEPCKSALKV